MHAHEDFLPKHVNSYNKNLQRIPPPPSNATTSCSDFSVTDFWVWDAQGARLRRPDDDGKVMDESVVPGGALKLLSTNYPDHGHRGRFSYSRKNAHGRAGNRTLDLMVSSQTLWPLYHEAGHNKIPYFLAYNARVIYTKKM
jgi:hypothetical protein